MIDIERILLELEMLPTWDKQICLQSFKGNNDPFFGCKHDGRGKVASLHGSNEHNKKDEDFTELLFDMKYTNSIIKELKMYRTRVMKLKYKTCYTYHRDKTKRIHIPLITNENCFIILDKEVCHYPADGNWFLVDTTKKHTAVNASWEDRIHIVGLTNG